MKRLKEVLLKKKKKKLGAGRELEKKRDVPLIRQSLERSPILARRLHAQAYRQHELADSGGEAGEEGVVRLCFFLSVH